MKEIVPQSIQRFIGKAMENTLDMTWAWLVFCSKVSSVMCRWLPTNHAFFTDEKEKNK